MKNPIDTFIQWWEQARADSPLRQKNAVCVSTINQDGFPEGRFVDLKAADKQGFVFCTYLDSNKGNHINNNPKVAITCWWDHVGLQVRIVGKATALKGQLADKFWQSRNKEAQITTLCCEQSKALESESYMQAKYQAKYAQLRDQHIVRPQNWGGYVVEPVSIEFLTFRESRLHLRELFVVVDGQWQYSLLQP